MRTKEFTLLNTIYIRYIFLILILFLGSCTFDSETEDITPAKPIKTINKEYFNLSKIVIVDKNWDHQKMDSIITTRKKIFPKTITSSADYMVFITQNADTIEFNYSKIHSENPIIVFTPENGPYLTTLTDFQKVCDFFFTKTDTIHLTSKKKKVKKIIHSSDYSQKKIHFRDTSNLNMITNTTIHEIVIPSETSLLQQKNELKLINRNLFYPILNSNQFLSIRFDNDFWDYTDYYYTNGAAIGYTHSIFAFSPISRLLVTNGNSGIDYYGVQMVQHLYTGFQPKVDTIVQGDRPWAAYSTIGQYLTSYDPLHKIKHYSEINIGLIGPKSGGGFIQNFVHTILPNNSPPEGWHNQIAADYILDYQYRIQKALFEAKNFETYIQAGAQVGSLRDNLQWGFGMRYGIFVPFYKDYPVYNRKRMVTPIDKKLRFNFVFDFNTILIGYDATLQGGLTNRTSVYVIPPGQMNRFVMQGYLGAEASYGRVELQFLQFWKSKEFQTGKDHKYVSIRLNIAF